MLYFIETISGKDLDHPVQVIRIGYASNFEKELKIYKEDCCVFKVIKTLKGRKFNRDHEAILHDYFSSKLYLDREGFFVKDDELVNIINSLNTVEDILIIQKLKKKCKK